MTRVALGESLRDAYLRVDPRTLGLGRIGFALVLIGDLARRLPWLRELYSNVGLIPNHTMLWRPPFPRVFSVFFMSSLPEESALWFAVSFVCFFSFLIGYRTRLFHVLSFVMTTSSGYSRISREVKRRADGHGGLRLLIAYLWLSPAERSPLCPACSRNGRYCPTARSCGSTTTC